MFSMLACHTRVCVCDSILGVVGSAVIASGVALKLFIQEIASRLAYLSPTL